ncbi:2-succinyl-5-enolpyruvyl-6-hydroxy-3-cyclohexene-1-carboxylic-acid synthase [Sporolactobacillus putidus]|uniref:2-succinyl-5-enolpyruvyl-6-hydroxy-3-cyclohexene-1-carboxylate synthase n=1 Tax=Sporolactobacillus putidus TaxID=492735 RepID=A0A917S0I9_9BACL|nr:2-succinyl-5-enolpyruvyl-6-hydroxy-3-cyclohexene-1-carboxylic-acid synthase [Sporolactobacillus putidus]GGL48582.1 2-succinyl-5-enolpyruvyl-6-hydroxy-3-cyclohexene-1-carboxylate synthase [Sporolactobacillus putidus]
MNHIESLTAYLSSFVDELVINGVRDVVVSPGSRSTPLALLFAENPEMRIYLDIDERSAGFLALGLAKAKKKPVALLCTSGTATANYYPAVVEAFCARIPLLVLTADRPRELQSVGAPQTIGQSELYGSHVKRFIEMEIPENNTFMLRYTRTVCARAVFAATTRPFGPVHLNFPLREPLLPDMKEAVNYRAQEKKAVSITSGTLALSSSANHSIAETIRRAQKGIIVCGQLEFSGMKEAITTFAERLGFPVLADPLSQLRRGSYTFSNIIECYDSFLRDEQTALLLQPDLVIRFGPMPVSKALMLWLKQQKSPHLVVDGGQGWRDPSAAATEMVYCDEERFCYDLIDLLPENKHRDWLALWRKINEAAKTALLSIRDEQVLSEEKAVVLTSDLMPDHSCLFVGNSMPIRELDTFLFTGSRDIAVYANRGANGIDGVVSTAVGVSLVSKHTVLVIGDLSFFHDMNGLLAAKQYQANLTIVLINNDGGGIFSFLPQASEKENFETLFGTPHGLDFSNTARLYGADYKNVGSWSEFASAFTHSFSKPGLKIIEIRTNREENVRKRRQLRLLVNEQISEVLGRDRQ